MVEIQTDNLSEYSDFKDYLSLLKPRVMSLVVFTAAVGLIVAPGTMNPILAFASILFIALGAGASGALNMWWDADIDCVMERTQSRPIPAGKITKSNAFLMGTWVSVFAVVMLGLASNWFAAGFLAFTIFFYVVIYSMWLKRSTPQNIVIGGAAGAFPPMIGWAAATGDITLTSLGMFMLIFMWTPPHFWALALFMNDDYTKVGVPMMTVTHGSRTTRKYILAYVILVTPFSVGLSVSHIGGPVYCAVSIILSIIFLAKSWIVFLRSDGDAIADNYAKERGLFRFSLLYLFLLFSTILFESFLKTYSLIFFPWPKVF